jgi:hypothetical protein
MDPVIPIWIGVMAAGAGTGLAAVCAFCALKPDRAAAYMRNRYLRGGKLVRGLPFSGIVLKSWYPAYLRWTGLGGLLCTLIWLGLLARLFSI